MFLLHGLGLNIHGNVAPAGTYRCGLPRPIDGYQAHSDVFLWNVPVRMNVGLGRIHHILGTRVLDKVLLLLLKLARKLVPCPPPGPWWNRPAPESPSRAH